MGLIEIRGSAITAYLLGLLTQAPLRHLCEAVLNPQIPELRSEKGPELR